MNNCRNCFMNNDLMDESKRNAERIFCNRYQREVYVNEKESFECWVNTTIGDGKEARQMLEAMQEQQENKKAIAIAKAKEIEWQLKEEKLEKERKRIERQERKLKKEFEKQEKEFKKKAEIKKVVEEKPKEEVVEKEKSQVKVFNKNEKSTLESNRVIYKYAEGKQREKIIKKLKSSCVRCELCNKFRYNAINHYNFCSDEHQKGVEVKEYDKCNFWEERKF